MSDADQTARILYTNHRGETNWRTIIPENVYYGMTEYHPDPQWLLRAYDVDKAAYRDFALAGVKKWMLGHAV